MKSKIPWQYTAILLFSLISLACKKDINQTKTTQLIQDDGSATTLDVTCIPNGIQFFKTESLSQAREFPLGIGLSNKVLFVGGIKQTSQSFEASERVDIYNTSSDSWSDITLSERKTGEAIAAGGTKIVIAGGEIWNNGLSGPISDQVDIYDVNSDSWTISHMSSARSEAAGVGYGDSLYFAGGFGNNKVHKTIDVYNTRNGSWSKLSLSLARIDFAAAATNNKILFAGGDTESGVVSDLVDIYDVHTATWSVSAISVARHGLVGAALGNLIIFGGGSAPVNGSGHAYDIVDIYNTSTGQWSASQIAGAAGWRQSAVQGTKMFFTGYNSVTSEPSMVDVYDICSNTWSKLSLTDHRGVYGAGAAGGKVLFGGGKRNNFTFTKKVDIFSLGPLIAQ